MTTLGIVTDVNRCVGCLGCSVACKQVNHVPVGEFWNKTLRIGPRPKYEGAEWPDVEMYFLMVQCQHCKNPECVAVCPTNASHVVEDGTVQIDKSKCIGCQFCVMACPYGVRMLNEEERVVEKCTLCEQQIAQGELPQCVSQCTGQARYFGDLDGDWNDLVGAMNRKMGDVIKPYSEDQVHALKDVGNHPKFRYILRNKQWQGEE